VKDSEAKPILKTFLQKNNYFLIHRPMVEEFGWLGAVLLTDLIYKESYWEKKDKLTNGWFFATQQDIEKTTYLSPYQQRRLIKELTEKKVIRHKRKGVHQKQHFRLRHATIYEKIKCEEPSQLIVENLNNKMLRNSTIHIRSNNKEETNKNCSKEQNVSAETSVVNKSSPAKESKNRIGQTKLTQVDPATKEIIDLWNKQPNLTAHTKPTTKVYKESIALIKQLRCKGSLERKHISEKFLTKFGVPTHIVSTPWRDNQIKLAIKNYNTMLDPEYWPAKKKAMPKSFPAFVCNPHSPHWGINSWYLVAVMKKPITLQDHFAQKAEAAIPEKEKELTEWLCDSMCTARYSDPEPTDRMKLRKSVLIPLLNWHDKLPEKYRIRGYTDTAKQTVIEYCRYIRGVEQGNEGLQPNYLKPGGKIWRGFIKAVNEQTEGSIPI